ncbi:MAG: Zn-ribbon domain-containing OB-fold protein, partial [Candidatus Hydrogenedentota bacterium]
AQHRNGRHKEGGEKMREDLAGVEPAVHKSGISVPYHWWAGETASRFFTAIRDEQKIMGIRCARCGKVFLPPRKTCPSCFSQNEEWVPLSTEGELISFTVARRQLAALPRKVPVIYGLIKLDGADTALLHMLGEVDPSEVRIGMRVAAKFSDNRTGSIMDIDYFTPV